MGGGGGGVVRSLASHQCGCGLSLLLVLILSPKVFSPRSTVFLPPQKNNVYKVLFEEKSLSMGYGNFLFIYLFVSFNDQ